MSIVVTPPRIPPDGLNTKQLRTTTTPVNYVDLYEERICDFNIKETLASCWSQPEALKRKLPILSWLPKYQPSYLIQDFLAGFTVGLTTIPQAIAYGVVAGLEPQYGLYSAFMGCFAYIVFGSCKDVTIATTSIMALMIQKNTVQNADYAPFTCFFVGLIILLLGLLNLGVLVRFISIPVITGFTIGAATTIGSVQINNLFGMASPSSKLLPAWKYFLTHLHMIRKPDAILGISSLIFILLMKKTKDIPYGNRTIWKYVSLSRNAVAVIIGTFLAYILSRDGHQPFRITGNITAGVPPFRAPPFTSTVNGSTISFTEMLSTVGISLATTPMVAILEIVAISKAFSKGKIVDASQELIALGMCNIMGSFVSSMPVTGSFTRTAVNNASGVKTTLGGAVTGSLVLIALAFLTQTFYFIPKATLSAIIIAAMISIVELDKIRDIWKSKKADLLPFVATLLPCILWSLEYGILCGIIANLSFILYSSAKPQMDLYIEKNANKDKNFVIVNVMQKLDYVSAEYLKEKIIAFVLNNQLSKCGSVIIINGSEIHDIDFTVAMNIITLQDDLNALNCDLLLWNWKLKAAGVLCRLNNRFAAIFEYDKTLEQVLAEYGK